MKKTTHSTSTSNPFQQFISLSKEHPDWFSKKIHQQIAKQERMLEIYDFVEDKGRICCDWIEKFCVLTEGENAGKPVKLMLWQKWWIYSILCFYGDMSVESFDKDGNYIGMKKKRVRIVNDVLLVVATGNAKTSLLGFINAYFLYGKEFPSCKIYIGSNSYKQSKICFDTTKNIFLRKAVLKKTADIRASVGEIEVKKNFAKLTAMSSDGSNLEGIIPAVLEIDEIHEMKNSAYADNLRKSTKREDFLIIETTTQGTVRGGYLDERIELATKTLSDQNEVENYRKFFAIFEQDSADEIFNLTDVNILRKSNPSLGVAVSVQLLKDKITEMRNDDKRMVVNLTKNFNIPQNPITSYFTEAECRTHRFNEDVFYNAPVFLGLDMAYTRNPTNDLTCLEILMVDPVTNNEYCKDIYFLPKYWEDEVKLEDKLDIVVRDMVKEKSKLDSNILYNPRQSKYGYQMYANRGDVVIVDERLVDELVDEFGEQARVDTAGITEEFVIFYIAHLEKKYNWTICKFGLDPNKASKIMSYGDSNIPSLDGKKPMIKFRMEDKKNSNPIILSTKDIRKQGKVYNNNKLSELHFASAQAKEDRYGNITFVNPMYSRKDGVIANLASRSAYNVFTTNKDTGSENLENMKTWWNENRERLSEVLSESGLQES